MIDPGYSQPSRKEPSQSTPVSEIKARNYAWRQSLEKGAKHCRNNGHEGDAQTLEDIAEYFKRNTPK